MTRNKKSKAEVKKAADRAAKRSTGEPVPSKRTSSGAVDHKPASRRRTQKGLGRRHTYTDALGRAICTMLASGMPLTQICRRPGMPSDRTVRTWAQDDEHPFSPQYTRARELGYHRMIDEIIDAADDGRNDWEEIETRGGGTIIKLNKEAVDRSKLRVEARKWVLAKALPKIYGDKVDVKHEAGDSFLDVWRALATGKLPSGEAE